MVPLLAFLTGFASEHELCRLVYAASFSPLSISQDDLGFSQGPTLPLHRRHYLRQWSHSVHANG